jgi:hypothetical protein
MKKWLTLAALLLLSATAGGCKTCYSWQLGHDRVEPPPAAYAPQCAPACECAPACN